MEPQVKYSFVSYPKRSPLYFAIEKARLKRMLFDAEIEHFGSTSVPGLGGKGVLDIIVNVPKRQFRTAKEMLEAKGYIYHPGGGTSERYFFRRTLKKGGEARFVHLHLVKRGSKDWLLSLAVREILRDDPVVRRDYVRVKKAAVRHAKGDGLKYRQFKNKFLGPLSKRAVRHYAKKMSQHETDRRRQALLRKR